MSLEALKRNGHNLELGKFERTGEYGVPVLRSVSLPGRLEWIRFNHALRETHRDRYGVHFFIDDYLFERAWHDPPRYALFLRQFPAVLTPDFSMFTDYPEAVQIYNHWRKHQLGAYWQRVGMTVIPTVGWIGRDSFRWCFDGEPLCPEKIIFFGDVPDECEGNIEHHTPYYDAFTDGMPFYAGR